MPILRRELLAGLVHALPHRGRDGGTETLAAGPNECRTQPVMHIYMLGPAWIEWMGQPLVIQRRQARGLLYRLAARLQPLARDELCLAFWPDEPESSARRHLSHLISHLRQSLPSPEVLCSSSELVELDPYSVWSDASVFRVSCAQTSPEQIEVLEQAVELYRGPFLSGFSLPDSPEFEVWMSQERTAYERLYLDTLAALMRMETDRAGYAKAILYGREYLKVDEVAEDVHRRLMVLHAMRGDRPAALQQYRECAAALKRRLGIAPLPETRAVYQAIVKN